MTPARIEEKLEIIDSLIKGGHGIQAKKEILGIKKSGKVPRRFLLPLAKLCRRSGSPNLGISLLRSLVRPEKGTTVEANTVETIEYADCLVRMGAKNEALSYLEDIDEQKHPEVLRAKAAAHMTNWNYQAAIPILEKLQENLSDPVQKTVMKVNLLACLSYIGDTARAQQLLADLLFETKEKKLQHMFATTIYLGAQLEISQENYKRARKYLKQVEEFLPESNEKMHFYLLKWNWVIDLCEDPNNKSLAAEKKGLEKIALSLLDWESVRNLDYYMGKMRKNYSLLYKVYFGSPMNDYRQQLEDEFHENWRLPNEYLYRFNKKKPAKIFSLSQACELNDSKCKLKAGSYLHKLFQFFCRDFYRGFNVVEIHDHIYKGEYYNEESSPQKIYTLVDRLKVFFDTHKIPLEINQSKGFYQLLGTQEPYGILVPREMAKEKKPEDFFLDELEKQFQKKWFSVKQVVQENTLPRRSISRKLSLLASEGKILKKGGGGHTRYQVI